jgi:ketosteroid isomerase-like protein
MVTRKSPKTTKATTTAGKAMEKVVNTYFKLIRSLRNGDEKSVPRLMDLWDHEGTFDFAGSPPLVGTFKGALAIQTLYLNRVKTPGMKLQLETRSAKAQDVTLGVVDTEVTHLRTDGNRAIAGWRTTIGTKENQGFDVAGSHLFTFQNGKIKSLRVSISPKPDQSQLENLRMADLSVADVGRLSLAAWPVV